MSELPLAPIARIIKGNTNLRVSEEATEVLREVLENKATEVAKLAMRFVNAAGRKTVKEEDIISAIETLKD